MYETGYIRLKPMSPKPDQQMFANTDIASGHHNQLFMAATYSPHAQTAMNSVRPGYLLDLYI